LEIANFGDNSSTEFLSAWLFAVIAFSLSNDQKNLALAMRLLAS
jgi:hypothetical protein